MSIEDTPFALATLRAVQGDQAALVVAGKAYPLASLDEPRTVPQLLEHWDDAFQALHRLAQKLPEFHRPFVQHQ